MAPVVQSGPKLSFRAGSRPGCLVMRYQFRLAQVVLAGNTVASPYGTRICFKLPGNGVPSYAFEIPVAPMNSWYFPTYIRQLMLLFNEYRVHGMSLAYQPRQTANTNNAFVWAYAEDVEWPESHGLLSGGAFVLPTEFALTSLPTACTTLTWAPSGLKASFTDSKMRYVAGHSFDNQLNYTTTTAALDRQSMCGIFMLFSDLTGGSINDTVQGDIYCDMTLELCDFSIPITSEIQLRKKERERDREREFKLRG